MSNIICEECGKDLMDNIGMSMVNIIKNAQNNHIVSFRTCCKGECDKKINYMYGKEYSTGWRELKELTNPILYKHFQENIEKAIKNDINFFENQEDYERYLKLIKELAKYVPTEVSEKDKSYAEMALSTLY